MRATLYPHPTSGESPVQAMHVEIERDGLVLWLRYFMDGDPNRMAWPAQAQQGRADALWERTCFEAFVTAGDGYLEYNLSPSGAWASYRFTGYREGMAQADAVATVLGLESGCDHAALEARIELPHDAGRLAVSAVIEAADGTKTYWALAHPSAKPDFHHPDSFVLDLP